MKKAVKRTHATQWAFAPHVQGAFSAASVGGQPSRRILMTEPLRDRVFYAGEAAHETLWGTVGGAWESGERAADLALKLLGPLTSSVPAQQTKPAKQQPVRRQKAAPKQQARRSARNSRAACRAFSTSEPMTAGASRRR